MIHDRFDINDAKWWTFWAVLSLSFVGIGNALTGGAVVEKTAEVIDKTTEVITETADNLLDHLREAIIGQESGGDHAVVNPDSGAIGLGQVMPENVGPWSRECLGQELTPEEFKNNPDLQVKIINCKIGQYWESAKSNGEGDFEACRSVAATWYSGDPTLKDSTRPQAGYPSISDYTKSVCSSFQGRVSDNSTLAIYPRSPFDR